MKIIEQCFNWRKEVYPCGLLLFQRYLSWRYLARGFRCTKGARRANPVAVVRGVPIALIHQMNVSKMHLLGRNHRRKSDALIRRTIFAQYQASGHMLKYNLLLSLTLWVIGGID